MKGLTDSLKNFVLKSGSENFTVKKCCFPRHGGLCFWISPFLFLNLFFPRMQHCFETLINVCVPMQNCPTLW